MQDNNTYASRIEPLGPRGPLTRALLVLARVARAGICWMLERLLDFTDWLTEPLGERRRAVAWWNARVSTLEAEGYRRSQAKELCREWDAFISARQASFRGMKSPSGNTP